MTITYFDLGNGFTHIVFEHLSTEGCRVWACNESVLMVL
jgi:hypothetical protein